LLRVISFDRDCNALFLVTAIIGLLLSTYQNSHLVDHSRVLRIEWEDDSVDAQHKAAAEENDKVSFSLGEEHVGITDHVIWEIIVGNPHVGKVEAQWQDDDAEEEQKWPEFSVSGEFKSDQHHDRCKSK